MKTLPDDVTAYKRTTIFDEETAPAGLLRAHTTKEGTWARIVVLEGVLVYRIMPASGPIEEHTLEPGREGVVEPRVPHEVAPRGPVRFYVEFWR
jgi:tellurite resistance-related uncharacterized protein